MRPTVRPAAKATRASLRIFRHSHLLADNPSLLQRSLAAGAWSHLACRVASMGAAMLRLARHERGNCQGAEEMAAPELNRAV